jgi:hypothetical protein
MIRAQQNINNWRMINRAIELQVLAKFTPERFNLEDDFIPANDAEKLAYHMLLKYHGDERGRKLWQAR